MYGLLRPITKSLTCESRKAYTRIYCGQCVALHDYFGYISRTLTSFDAAFFGLLIAAQRDEPMVITRRRCAIFPKKKDVCAPDDTVAHISAALAVYLSAIKLTDRQHEGNSPFLALLEKLIKPKAKQADVILTSYGIPALLAADTIHYQHIIEQRSASEIIEYARPTELFLRDLLGITAIIAGKPENSNVLAQIGTRLGRIIYLVDSCVDMLDDMERKAFNALLAVYAADGGELRSDTGDQITNLIMQSLVEIRGLLPRLKLVRYQEIVDSILETGLALMIQRQLSQSMIRLKKYRPVLLKYAPHAALTVALCLFSQKSAEAASALADEPHCGCACSSFLKNPICEWFDMCCNPCFCSCPGCDNLDNICCGSPCAIICQAPKAILTPMALSHLYHSSEDYRNKYASLKIKKEEERRKREQEKQRQAELKRNQDNADFLENATKDIKKYAQSIKSKLATLQGLPLGDPRIRDIFFNKKIQRLVADKQSIRYSSSPEIENGIKKIIMEAVDMDQNIQSVLESVNELKQEIASVRQSQQPRDDCVENQLKFYEELISPIEVKSLIVDYRFEDYHEIAKKIHADLSMLVKKQP